MTIRELRILPPLAISRLGAAESPMDNYEVAVDPERPLSARKITPAPTFEVSESGEIRQFTPKELRFAEDGKVRPVAPFLEVWALTDSGELEPLTVDLLSRVGASPADIRWSVHLGNHKILRRTGDPGDKIEAKVKVDDHERHPIAGTSKHFWPGKELPLGHVQYVKPTAEFPEIRFRYTPAAGLVYGSSKENPDQVENKDPNIVEVLYDANKGAWLGYTESAGPTLTIPAQIYAGTETEGGAWKSKGYLDDECDGIVRVELKVKEELFSAYAHIGAGPPAYAPDRFPIRTVADELEQAIEGPEFDGQITDVEVGEVEEIVRRALETVQVMNTEAMNGNVIDGKVDVASTMVRQDTADTGRYFEPIMATSLVDMPALENLHQNLLVALRSGTAPWFADVLRDYDEIGDLTDRGRRKMPGMMRGADGRHLALTRRQVSLVRAVARRAVSPGDNEPGKPGEEEAE